MDKEKLFEKIQWFIHSQRRKLALLVCLVLIASILPESAFAAEGDPEPTEQKTYTIVGNYFGERPGSGIPSQGNLPKEAKAENVAKDGYVNLGRYDGKGDKGDYYLAWKGWYSTNKSDDDKYFLGVEGFELNDENLLKFDDISDTTTTLTVYAKYNRCNYYDVTFDSGMDVIDNCPVDIPDPEVVKHYYTEVFELKESPARTDVIRATNEDKSSTIWTFNGWSHDGGKTVYKDTFTMLDKAVTFTGVWVKGATVCSIDFNWIDDKGDEFNLSAGSVSKLPVTKDVEPGTNYILPTISGSYSPSEYVTYTFDKWIVDGEDREPGVTIPITENTIITGRWVKSYSKKADITYNLTYDDVIDSDVDKAKIRNTLVPKIDTDGDGKPDTAIDDKDIEKKVYPDTIVYLPKLEQKTQIDGLSGYMSNTLWNVTYGNDDKISLSSDGTYSWFKMPQDSVKITANIIKETAIWRIDDLVEITRDNIPFNPQTPKSGFINIKVWVGDPAADTVEELEAESGKFFYNYSGVESGTASIDINVLPLDGYHIYKVVYNACFGHADGKGPENTTWKDGGIFLMDNVSDGSTVNIYLAKTYNVKFMFEGTDGNSAEASEYVDGFPPNDGSRVISDIYPFKIESFVTPCNRQGEDNHSKCDSGNAGTIKNLAQTPFTEKCPYNVKHKFTVPAVNLLADKDNLQLVQDGKWRTVNDSYVSAGEVDLSELTSAELKELLGSDNTIPLTVAVEPKTAAFHSVTYEYKNTIPAVLDEVTTPEGDTAAANTEVTVDPTYDETSRKVVNGITYVFSGWKAEGIEIESGKFTMPDKDVVFTGEWTVLTGKYKVEHYLQNLDNEYVIDSDATQTYEEVAVGTEVEAKHLQSYLNGDYDISSTETSELSGTVRADDDLGGSLVLKLYYDLKTNWVKYEYAQDTPEGINGCPLPTQYKAGQTVEVMGVKPGDTATVDGKTYKFVDWKPKDNAVSVSEDGTFTMPNKEVVFIGEWAEQTGSYTVRHFLMKPDGTYPGTPNDTEPSKTVAVGEVTAQPNPSYLSGNYEVDTTKSKLKGDVTADGVLVLNVYYKLKEFEVRYVYKDGTPGGIAEKAPLPDTKKHRVGETGIAVEGAETGDTVIVGDKTYIFVCWETDVDLTDDNKFTMPAENVVFTGEWAEDVANYTVNHYQQQPDGSYKLVDSYERKDTVGDEVTVKYLPKYLGSDYKESTKSVLSGTVLEDGSLILKVYYELKKYEVSYVYKDGTPQDIAKEAPLPTAESYFVGTKDIAVKGAETGKTVTVGDKTYIFVGWETDVDLTDDNKFTMPGQNVVFTGEWAEDVAKYTVNHYQQQPDGSYKLVDSYERKDTVGDEVTVKYLPKYLGSDYKESTKSKLTGTVLEDGSLVLDLYYELKVFEVSYLYKDDTPKGIDKEVPLPDAEKHTVVEKGITVKGAKHGDTVTVGDKTYTFVGWDTADAEVTEDKFDMPHNDVVFIGEWAENVAGYTVNHYLQQPDGNYPDKPERSDKKSDTIGDEVTAVYIQSYLNGNYNKSSKSELTGTVLEDGSLVLKVYYELKKFKVSYVYEEDLPEGIIKEAPLPTTESYYVGKTDIAVKGAPSTTVTVNGKTYKFVSWETTDVSVTGNKFEMPGKNVVFTGTWTVQAEQTADYTISHYLQKPDGSYEAAPEKPETKTDAVGTTVTAEYIQKYLNGDYKESTKTVLSGEVKADGSLKLDVYYDLKTYEVSYAYNDGLPEDIKNNYPLPDPVAHRIGETGITVADAPNPPSVKVGDKTYIFSGWKPKDDTVKIEDNKFTMPDKKVEFIGTWTVQAEQTADYTISHYLQKPDGSYEAAPEKPETKTATVGTTVTAEYIQKYLNGDYQKSSDSVLSGEVKADGSLKLDVYYDLKTYEVSYAYNDGLPEDIKNNYPLPDPAAHRIGETGITVAGTPNPPSVKVGDKTYVFSGWKPKDDTVKVEDNKFTMPDKKVEFIGTWTVQAEQTANYTISHYLQKPDGSYEAAPEKPETKTAAVGTIVTAEYIKKYLDGNYKESSKTVLSGEVKTDGSLVINVYYDLKSKNVTYSYVAGTPDGIRNKATLPNKGNPISKKIGEKVPLDTTLKSGDKITTDDGRTYTFNGWEVSDNVYIPAGSPEFTMPAEDVTIVGTWTETTEYAYVVEYYFEQLDGKYVLNPSSTKTGKALLGTQITAAMLSAQDAANYNLNTAHPDTVSMGLVSRDGLTLRLYYTRDTHTITFRGGDHGDIGGDPGNKISILGKYGSVYPKIPTPKPADGYTFDGWYDETGRKIITFPDTITDDMTYTARYEKIEEDDDDDDDEPVDTSVPKSPKTGEGQTDYTLMLIAILSVMCSMALYRRNKRI